MTKRTPSVPSLFCEWIVGTSIEAALGPIPAPPEPKSAPPPEPKPEPKPSKHDVFRLELTTDDEAEEDTLRVTYPRHDRTKASQRVKVKAETKAKTEDIPAETESEADSDASSFIVKRVRFEAAPLLKKSALKKSKVETSESEAFESDAESSQADTESSAVSTDSSSDKATGASSSEESTKASKAKKKKKKEKEKEVEQRKKKKKHVETSSSELETTSTDDSEPHPTCKCHDCTAMRSKTDKGKKGKGASSDSEASQSEAEVPPKSKSKSTKEKAKAKAKQKEANEISDSGSDDDNGESTSENEEKKSRKKKPAKGKGKDKQDDEKMGDTSEGDDKKEDTKPTTAPKEGNKPTPPFPQPFMPASHSRRSQLIEPIRAQLVQTEQVVEGPEDPVPNAYFDSKNNVLRVYHGPVYGNHYYQNMYPRHDPNNGQFPTGFCHPMQNPYNYGFRQPRYDLANGQQQPLVSDGMPGPDIYDSKGRVTGYPPGYVPWRAGDSSAKRGSYKYNAKGPAVVNQGMDMKDNGGPKLGLDNPYIPEETKSRFGYGRNREFSAGNRFVKDDEPMIRTPRGSKSGRGPATDQAWATSLGENKDANKHTGGDNDWGNANADANSYNNNNNDTTKTSNWWDNNDFLNRQNNEWPTAASNTWGNGSSNNNNNKDTSFNKVDGGADTSKNDGWDAKTSSKKSDNSMRADANNVGPTGSGTFDSNPAPKTVMPGSFLPDTDYTSNWQDTSLGASTKGTLDEW